MKLASDTITIAIPRSAVQVIERPRCVSQRSADRVLGLPRRMFLRLAAEYAAAGGTVISLGRLRLVELDPFVGWLSTRTPKGDVDPVAALASELGLEG